MKVRDVMTTSVASVRSDEPLSSAARLMWDCDCGAIPVIDPESERVVGMITDRDVCMATWSRDCSPSVIMVSGVMSRDLFYCTPSESISSAENLMRQQQIRRLPVLDGDGKLCGILSLADLVAQPRGTTGSFFTGDLPASEVAATLASICQPRGNGASANDAR
jgi:CBS domain-containing protein